VTHSFDGFPVATAAEFRELLLAIGASGAAAAKPTALDRFLDSHPIAKTFLTTQDPAPESYATLDYFGVNSFAFTNARGVRTFVRYQFKAVGGEAFVAPDVLATKGPDYLQEELPGRLANGPVAFEWYAQVAEAADAVADPSVAWPESRRLVKLGVIRIDAMAPDAGPTDRATMFTPLNVPAGIEAADPMLGVRQGAYPLSFRHRQ
jgi:catalase